MLEMKSSGQSGEIFRQEDWQGLTGVGEGGDDSWVCVLHNWLATQLWGQTRFVGEAWEFSLDMLTEMTSRFFKECQGW